MKTIFSLLVSVILLSSCSSEPSLQKYLVDKDSNRHFITASVSSDLLVPNFEKLKVEEQESIKKIRKINMLALKSNVEEVDFEGEKTKVLEILKKSEYKSLIEFNGQDLQAQFLYSGSEEKIEEMIFFGADDNTGMLLVRMLGEKLNPNDLVKLMEMADEMELEEFESFGQMLGESFENEKMIK
ncbi:DUF4252 domain-containing protein [Psychroflexus aestuariivivens]|uniref:DUF4252 domain-containing protein n=1 Tax=Psychroflexus aestuariivivens TaxID=1795040 RepID=UPI000FD6BC34|nr:DUF4252 domain-containing protein [Psychroflexus aestuariivivens]